MLLDDDFDLPCDDEEDLMPCRNYYLEDFKHSAWIASVVYCTCYVFLKKFFGFFNLLEWNWNRQLRWVNCMDLDSADPYENVCDRAGGPRNRPKSYVPDKMLVVGVKAWLGDEGLSFFREAKTNHGTVSPVLFDKLNNGQVVPHSVHSNEGMQVRNFLRQVTGNTWTAHQYDDRWVAIVEEAIKE